MNTPSAQEAATRRPPPPVLAALWGTVFLLVIIGVAAALGRGFFPSDLATRMEPVRRQLLTSFHRTDPFAQDRAAELLFFDSRFAANPLLTLLHVLPGGLFLTLALLQFSPRVRRRNIRFHRWSGRVLVLCACVAGATALYFGLFMPFGGPGEAVPITIFGVLFLGATLRAFAAIRKKDVPRHREWMIRAFALAVAISTVRIVAAVLDIVLTPAGFGPRQVFVLSVWTGWVVTVAAAELWIRLTRPRADSIAIAAGGRETGAEVLRAV